MAGEKRRLEVGERVRVFDVCKETQLLTSDTGTVREIRPTGALFIKLDNWGFTSDTVWHPRQVRRLVKKPRREFWINPIYLPSTVGVALRDLNGRTVVMTRAEPGFVHIREVRAKRGEK